MSVGPNSLFRSDCHKLLERLDTESVDLVYLDPPWFTRRDFHLYWPTDFVEPRPLEGARSKKENLFGEYVNWLSTVLQHSYRITKGSGNLVVHADVRTVAYVRMILDELFEGVEVREILLRRPRVNGLAGTFRDDYEKLILCRKSSASTWNHPTEPLSERDAAVRFRNKDSRGRFALVDLTYPAERPNMCFSWHNIVPPPGKSWRFNRDTLDRLDQEGRIFWNQVSAPRLKQYLDEMPAVLIGNIWDDLPTRVPAAERVNYSSQQPQAVLKRLIMSASNENDLFVDPFCGSGTGPVTAQALGRRWIAADVLEEAYHLTCKRLQAAGFEPGKDFYLGNQDELDQHEIVQHTNLLLRTDFPRKRPTQFILNQSVSAEEMRHCEFKSVTSKNPVRTVSDTAPEYAVAFLNREGGSIFWGIDDSDGKVTGVALTRQQRDEVRKAVENKLRAIQPPISPSFWQITLHEVYAKLEVVADLFVVELFIAPPPQGTWLYATSNDQVFVKSDSGIKRLTAIEIQQEVQKRVLQS